MMSPMGITASLVVGIDGSTTWSANSAGISTPADSADFLARRKGYDCIIIGGNTARTEPYSQTPVPLVIISRGEINPVPQNPDAFLWNVSITDAIEAARKEFGADIHIEAGASLVKELLEKQRVDDLYLTLTPALGGSHPFDWKSALKTFPHCAMHEIGVTKFYHASKLER
ncbi:MAG: hypothetical protein D4Q78_00330 [Streptomycetaceae bacterium]|jgi:riboflavin biosynthesis pyrimidine reductase|nr:MAG: hypothetical protein D4Q78_00330 [Streptomycetaceae bacterium]